MSVNLQGMKKLIAQVRPEDPRLFEFLNRVLDAAISASHLTPMSLTQVDLSSYVAGLGQPEAGRLFYVTDYNHSLLWDGQKLVWAPGDLGSDYYVKFQVGPQNVVGWVPADGKTVNALQMDGTLKPVTTQVIANNWYRI